MIKIERTVQIRKYEPLRITVYAKTVEEAYQALKEINQLITEALEEEQIKER